MTVGMNNVRLNVAFVLHQAVENIDRLSNAAGNKVRKQRDVFCADDKVRDPSVTAVTNVILREQILFIQVPFRSVRRGPLA